MKRINSGPDGVSHEAMTDALARTLLSPQMLMILVAGAGMAILASMSISSSINDTELHMGSSHWDPAPPAGGKYEVDDSDYYSECPGNPLGHTWAERPTYTPRDSHGNRGYYTHYTVCVNCGAYFN